jgi:CubicO group peptidase (beta-lactamase class C family)
MRRKLPATLHPFLALALALPAGLPAQTLGGRFLDAAIDSAVADHLASGRVAGVTVAVARGEDLLHLQGYGHADLELGVPTPLDAVYEIGSVTKQFTAVLTLMLVEDGLLDLDADISEYPPTFDTGGRRVPLRRLLDHTSGMKGYTETAVFGALATQALPPDTLLRLMEREEWDFEPGYGLIYNNTAYFLLGRILEEVSGSTYADLLTERILEPLGMDDTHYCDPARIVPGRAKGYRATPDGMAQAPYLDHRWPFAGGSMCSTARDLIRWNRALHGGYVLEPESYQALVTPEPLADGSPIFYAKGLVHREDDYGEVIEHGGGIFGFLSTVRYYPREELTLVVLQNTAGEKRPGEVLEGVASLLLPRSVAVAEAVAYSGDLSLLAGTYRGPARGRSLEVGIRADGTALYARVDDGDESRLVHRGEGLFEEEGGRRMWFVDDDGRPVGARPDLPPEGMRVGGGPSGLFPLVRQGG